MRSEDEIRKELKENLVLYEQEFSGITIPIEKYPQACGLKGFIDGLKYVLQEQTDDK